MNRKSFCYALEMGVVCAQQMSNTSELLDTRICPA